MIPVVGFEQHEEQSIRQMIDRFRARHFRLGELQRIEKADLPGYDGKVIPRLHRGSMETRMYLSSCAPFTIAHELAHVSDIAVRREDSRDNLAGGKEPHWHLAYKMSSEYYANRIACEHADGDDCFRAFRSDAGGLLSKAAAGDWGEFLVYFALGIGILHGIGRMDLDPLAMVGCKTALPERVKGAIESFKTQAVSFFDGYTDLALPSVAAA